MPEWLLWLIGVGVFLLMLAVSVGLHEAGHMSVAKLFKLHVPKFFVGFGPRIWSIKGKRTEYGVRAIPLGGFVTIEDERYEEKSYERLTMSRVAPWKRQFIFLAGPAVNIVLGSIIIVTTLMVTPYEAPSTTVASIAACSENTEAVVACGASSTDMRTGDTIVAIDGERVSKFEELNGLMVNKETIDVTVNRSGSEVVIPDVPLLEAYMGINVETSEQYRTFGETFTYIGTVVNANLHAISTIPSKVPAIAESVVTGERPEDSPSSVVGISKAYGDTTASENPLRDKVVQLALYSGVFNLGLGIINLLPIMPLDGGRMLVAFTDTLRMRWAKFRRKTYEPVGATALQALSFVSVIGVFGFMALMILSDFSLIFHGNL